MMKIKHTSVSLVLPFFLVIVFSLFLFSACTSEQGNKKNSEQANENTEGIEIDAANASSTFLTINKPFGTITGNERAEGIHVQNPTEASSHTTKSGTIINIPANAFVDESGNPIASPVDIQFQEINTATEIISSGIPMKMIDDNGDMQWMQTAGMYKITGSLKGESIEIAAGKSIEVDLVSDVDGEYGFWYFDEEKGNWINKGTNSAVATNMSTEARSEEINRLQVLTKVKPSKPKNDELNKLIFNDLDLSKCPKLKGKKEIVLSYVGVNPKDAPKKNKWINRPGTWHKKVLKPTSNADVYQLTLLGDKMYQIDVKLALSALEVDRENADYQKRLAEYRANMKVLRDKEKIISTQRSFRRLMGVQQFGIHNYDILWKRPNAIALNADFDFEGIPNEIKQKIVVYLITDNDKTIVGLPYRDWSKFRFVPSQENNLLAILPSNRVVIFTNNDFKTEKENMIEAKNGDYVFSMKKKSSPITSIDDLQDLLTME